MRKPLDDMRDRSNEPRTIIIAGFAMILLAVAMAPLVWWLATGVQAGTEDKARFESSPRSHGDVVLYTYMIRAIGLFIGLVVATLAAAGSVIVWKGLKEVRRRSLK